MTKDFPLNLAVPGFPATSKLVVSASTEPDVMVALVGNTPFPDRELSLGKIGVDFDGQSETPMETGAGSTSFAAAANSRLGLGVYTNSASALSALAFEGASDLKLSWTDDAANRLAVLVAGYTVKASGNLTHPVGALGSASFGVEGGQVASFAIVKGFAKSTGATDTLNGLFKGWRLPISIKSADDLPLNTSVLVEASGSLGLKVGATLGYDFSFVREIQAGGLAGDVGLKVATALATTVGLSASGRFIVCVERTTAQPALRLRLFKLAKKGWTFALNLNVGAEAITPPLPGTIDELVQLVFGVHRNQVIADLAKLEQWTDPKQSLGDLVAGLTNTAALDLIQKATGLDPAVAFEAARQRFLGQIKAWQTLPAKTSAWLSQKLEAKAFPDAIKAKLSAALEALTSPSDDRVKAFIASVIKEAGFDRDVVGQFLDSAAGEDGVLSLFDRVPQLRALAQQAQQVLNGHFLEALEEKISTALNLNQIINAVTSTDWDKIDSWLLARLSVFFGETLGFNRLDAVRGAIHAVIERRKTLYEALSRAVTRTYEAKFASLFDSSGASTALIDASFDLGVPAAQQAYRAIVETGQWDGLFLSPIEGVSLGLGTLTHGLARSTHTQLTLPSVVSKLDSLTSSLAQLTIESEGSELVGTYELESANDTGASGRFKSRLSLTAAFAVSAAQGSQLRIHGEPRSSWSYLYRFVRANASIAEVRGLLDPIRQGYFNPLFSNANGSFDTWLTDLDRAVEDSLHNGTNDFGNLLVSFELTLPSSLFATWFVPRSTAEQLTAAALASKAIQRTLRALLLQAYGDQLVNINQNESTFALLTYASLPLANAVRIEGDQLILDGSSAFWDWPDPALVFQLSRVPQACARLQQAMEGFRGRLDAAGRHGDASFFAPDQVSHVISTVSTQAGYSDFLRGLLFVEAELIRGVTSAIATAATFASTANTAPAKALNALADLGATLTETFNQKLKSIYLPSSLRTIGSVLFGEATRALSANAAGDAGRALLALTVLSEKPSFKMSDFIGGKAPTNKSDVALEQRLVRGI